MKIETSRFGDVEVAEDAVLSFPNGLIGMPDSKRFALLDGPEGTPFKWLQSLDEDWLAFVIVDPLLVIPDYEVLISPGDLQDLQLPDVTRGVVAVICSIPGDVQSMTVNLMGPVVFNVERRIGKQVVLGNPEYTTKYPVFSAAGEEV